jgi:hypothetical protein
MLAGKYSLLKRRKRLALNDLELSLNSSGIESTDSYTEKIMFQTILVNIKNIAANSTPKGLPLNKAMKKDTAAGKNPSMGTD